MTATPYSGTLTATGGIQPYTWSVVTGQLPAGLILNAQAGTITGTPILTGTSVFTVQVQDHSQGAGWPSQGNAAASDHRDDGNHEQQRPNHEFLQFSVQRL